MLANRRPRETTVQVVSDALQKSEFGERWLANNGASLAERSAALVAEAVENALQWEAHQAVTPGVPVPFVTYRYSLGQHEHMERAQRIGSTCGRAILYTLRGQYLSVPMVASDCESGHTADPPRVPAETSRTSEH